MTLECGEFQRFARFLAVYWKKCIVGYLNEITLTSSFRNAHHLGFINQNYINVHCSKYMYLKENTIFLHLDRVKRIWYLSPMRATKVQASLRIRAVSQEPSLLAHTSSESRRTFRQKTRSLAPLTDHLDWQSWLTINSWSTIAKNSTFIHIP